MASGAIVTDRAAGFRGTRLRLRTRPDEEYQLSREPSNLLPSWNDGPVRRAVIEFLDASAAVPVDQRVAVFDNDGTLWCEKPNYVQLLFMLDQLHRAAAADPSLIERPEYRALLEQDATTQAELGLAAIVVALVELCAGIEPVEFDRRVRTFFESARHPDLDVPFIALRYTPMLELIDELRARDFTVFIATGGGTEFVRAISNEFYGVDRERVVGSAVGYRVTRDEHDRPVLLRTAELFGDVNEGSAKVSNIQRALGRRPIFAAGNSPGDSDMLDYALTAPGPSMAMLLDHDDGDREYAYESRAGSFDSDGSIAAIGRLRGWNVVSMRDDWAEVFSS
jgi:phosphoserine phosphatase